MSPRRSFTARGEIAALSGRGIRADYNDRSYSSGLARTLSETGRYDNIPATVNRRQVVIGTVGIVVGFILGFFTNQAVYSPQMTAPPAQSGMPENHPSPEMMAQVEQLTELVQKEPENRDAKVRLANALYDIGRFDSAIPLYEAALEMDPSDVLVSTDLATAYLYTGKVDKALEQYQKSLVIEPDHAQTLQNMGIAYFSIGEYQKGIDVWERLVSVHPDYPNIADVRQQIETARMHLNQATSQ